MANVMCVNLQVRFGNIYRIVWDPAYDPDYKHVPRAKRDPWHMQIPCRAKGVTIYPHGGNLLALECDGHYSIARRIAGLPGVTLYQDGCGEKTYLFPLSMFKRIAAIVKPKRRRRMSEAQQQVLAAHWFAAKPKPETE
jgi:hypothetical protein